MRLVAKIALIIGVSIPVIFAALLITYVALGQPGSYAEAATIADGVQNFGELSDRFAELAEKKGGVYAYEVLKRAKLPPQTDLHLLGHAIGYVLYEEKGVAGIALCSQDFRNACSHAIVIGAFSEFGEGALPMIHEACLKAPGGGGAYAMCYHGLGHGVFAYFDYSLPETIASCKKTGTSEHNNEEYIQCVGGVIMELMGGGGHNPEAWTAARKKYLTDDPLAPCTTSVIPNEAKPMCLNYLTPHLWEEAGIDLANPDPSLFPKAFAFCDRIPPASQELREACFGGFGKDFVPLAAGRDTQNIAYLPNETYADAISWCEKAGESDGEAMCIGEAVASIFWGGENNPDGAFRFCSLVGDPKLAGACYSRLASDIKTFVVNIAQREKLCTRVPVAYQGSCARPL